MPPYLTFVPGWESIWPFPILAFLVAILLYLIAKIISSNEDKTFFFVIFAFSLLGLVTGYLTGFSRDPVVGAVLPAVLSLFGGLAVFLIQRNNNIRIVVSFSVISFIFCLLIGTAWGAQMRSVAEEYKLSADYLMRKAHEEVKVKEFRRSLGLPEDYK